MQTLKNVLLHIIIGIGLVFFLAYYSIQIPAVSRYVVENELISKLNVDWVWLISRILLIAYGIRHTLIAFEGAKAHMYRGEVGKKAEVIAILNMILGIAIMCVGFFPQTFN